MLTRSFPSLPVIIRTGRAIPVLSEEMMAELTEVLHRPKFRRLITTQRADRFIAFLRLTGFMVDQITRVEVCRDPKDDYLLSLAIDGKADAMVTGDDDLLALDPFRGIRIVAPAEFLRSFK